MSDLTTALADLGFRGTVEAEKPLGPLTTWRIGGPAEWLVTPRDAEDVALALRAADEAGVPRRILGNGSNLLVADDGVRGMVLRLRKTLDSIEVDGHRLAAGAGASFPALARAAAAAGIAGLEFATGIPGTVGGAVVMNAGWHDFETRLTAVDIDVIQPDGSRLTIPAAEADLGYRHSRFRGSRDVIVGATFAGTPDDPAAIQERIAGFTESRRRNQPTAEPSCGSVFLKPPGDFAGRLIEAAGLKGKRIGGIEISTLHANFFVNVGGGTAADVLALVELAESEVGGCFDVNLIREFSTWPDDCCSGA